MKIIKSNLPLGYNNQVILSAKENLQFLTCELNYNPMGQLDLKVFFLSEDNSDEITDNINHCNIDYEFFIVQDYMMFNDQFTTNEYSNLKFVKSVELRNLDMIDTYFILYKRQLSQREIRENKIKDVLYEG